MRRREYDFTADGCSRIVSVVFHMKLFCTSWKARRDPYDRGSWQPAVMGSKGSQAEPVLTTAGFLLGVPSRPKSLHFSAV